MNTIEKLKEYLINIIANIKYITDEEISTILDSKFYNEPLFTIKDAISSIGMTFGLESF